MSFRILNQILKFTYAKLLEEQFAEEVIYIEMDLFDTVEEQIVFLKGKLHELKTRSRNEDITMCKELRTKLNKII